MHRVPILFALVAAATGPAAAQATFDITFDPSADVLQPAERAAVATHLREAGRRWSQALGATAPVTIAIRVAIADVPTANGASAATAFVGVFGGRDTFEQGAAHKLRTGVDVNGADADGIVTFGLNYLRNELWFDPDPVLRIAPVPANRTDAFSVALHELGHVLAYNGWADLTTGQPPATYWSTFDRWMMPGAPTLFAGPAATQAWGVAPDLTTGNNTHWANPVLRTGRPAAVPAPVRWAGGAPVPIAACGLPMSIDAPPSADAVLRGAGGLIDQLMNGVVFYRGTRYDLSALDRAVLADVGLLRERIFAGDFEPDR
ncbi:hypothetical protein [Dokdonella koreensis]|uniref:Uncharacterized protein n=1 Tax=Dokdonella koreensis DS-123 TaxID=1300342 RepID=A0A167H131_9GAMM|nr:hypothetical protein [Dokdonella koreensis]ANB18452.1 Hypothetical protein I596_2444 [Dokdonella koreensis DS-123]